MCKRSSILISACRCVGVLTIFVLPLGTFLPADNLRRPDEQRVIVLPSHANEAVDFFFLDAARGWALVRGSRNPIVAVLKTDDGGRKWQQIGLQRDLFKLFFLNATHGWALSACRTSPQASVEANQVCTFGTVDGGKTWTKLSSIGINPPYLGSDVVMDFRFVDDMRGWAVGQSSKGEGRLLLKTTDGGRSYSNFDVDVERFGGLTRILSSPEGGICVLGNNLILTSSDLGQTWQVRMPSKQTESDDVVGQLWGGWFFRGGRGLAVGNRSAGLVLSTENYGQNWTTVTDSLTANSQDYGRLTDISFYDESHGCATLDWNQLACTSDSGKTWTNRTISRKATGAASFEGDSFRKIILLPNGLGWLISEHGFLYQTSDWGQSWNERDLLKS
jgi:photosystem II stability/assembly factor-like uncharacterized protein